MSETVLTGSANQTFYFEGSERVFPCRCGKTHRGEYAWHDWAAHECPHDDGLLVMREPSDLAFCAACGTAFLLELSQQQEAKQE